MYNNQLVFIENNKVVTDSLMVAEVFEKRHGNVIRDIRELDCSHDFNELNFESVNYLDKKGEFREKYILTKDGLMFLVMGYRGAKAAEMKERYIEEFNRMEQYIKNGGFRVPNTLQEALRLAADLEEERLLLEEKVKEQEPKVEFHDKVLRPGGLLTTTTIAKDYGTTAVRFNRLLHDLGIQYNQGGQWHLYSKYADKGYTDYETYEDGYTQMKWTQKGRKFLYQLLQDRGFVPVSQVEKEEVHTRKGEFIALTAY
ncbi:phage regulatory protein/antirepressor Ant [Thermoactinomyces sp. DSM 45892]|uniref:phage regulatory protein/antirepressor Ant n=1 Tax=Thermoactinomyces sp. DSM 45892 TaxID=1882753 RepID=UPI000899106A|nr:phage regulatory protein/antirepressor Ant [Thermoactinomyces sp. DSM 45892]SDY22356.1 phage regulatory protein, rha family [Thermoactinomyces sp. DSM 45892]